MKEAYYFHGNTVIMNYSKKYIPSMYEIVNSEIFEEFLHRYLDYLHKHNLELYRYLSNNEKENDQIVKDLKQVVRILLGSDMKDIGGEFSARPKQLLDVVESAYLYWRQLQRYSFLYTTNDEGFQIQNFVSADSNVNAIVLEFYRRLQQRVEGVNNRVFRQLQAGTNAALLLSYYDWEIPAGYEDLEGIPFVNEILLRTPLLLHSKYNKRTNTFTEAKTNPMKEFVKGDEEWICYPAKVGQLLIYAFFHRDFITGCVGMANLFELADRKETLSKQPDAILLFGNDDGKEDTVFYQDKKTNIWVGKNSARPEIDYFGYTKKSILTLHNLVMMERGWLPIHGAMVNIVLKDGTKKGLMFMGDSGAGKSETLEALNIAATDIIDYQETVFDDMGTLHINEDGEIRAQGTEIGAFVRLDDLDKGTAYRDMDRSIFFNPEKSNARVNLILYLFLF